MRYQFIAPVKFCDLCGARVMPGEVPEPDDSPEHAGEEETGPVGDQTSEPDAEGIPEPDTDELPADNDEEIIEPAEEETRHRYKKEIPEPDSDELPVSAEDTIEPAEEETRHRYKKEIPEPDTDELLDKYGEDYGEDETLESSRTPQPLSPIQHAAKKPVPVPAPPGRRSSEAVDDALFLSPGKPGAPAKRRVNRTRIIGGGIVLVAIIAAVYFIGLPVLMGTWGTGAHSNQTGAETGPTVTGTITPALTATPAPASRALVPLPTQLLPSGQKIYFYVQKNPVTSKISVIFTGSAGAGSIVSAEIKVTHPDGSVATGIILPLKGVAEQSLDGSNKTDRVEIIAKMSSGGTYRVYDELVPFTG